MPYEIEREDTLGLRADQAQILGDALQWQPLPVPDLIAHNLIEAGPGNEAGAVDVDSYTAAKIERSTLYRFHRSGMLNEHLAHAWPGPGYDFPALTTVIFEMPEVCIIGADFIPVGDVAFDQTYYGRHMLGYADVVARHWPTLTSYRLGPEPPPSPYFTLQVGSSVGVLLYLDPAAIAAGKEFLLDVTAEWTNVYRDADPVADADAVRVEARRLAVMKRAYKGLDYHSPAGAGLASVLGWTGANMMFDAVFGPDDPPQVADGQRTYLDVDISPGTPPRPVRG
jgi:hypothetical protein